MQIHIYLIALNPTVDRLVGGCILLGSQYNVANNPAYCLPYDKRKLRRSSDR